MERFSQRVKAMEQEPKLLLRENGIGPPSLPMSAAHANAIRDLERPLEEAESDGFRAKLIRLVKGRP